MNLTKQQIDDMRTSLGKGAQPFTKEAIDTLCALATSALAEGVAWKPINTAPKDGGRCIVGKVGSHRVYTAHWEVDPSWSWKGESPCWAVFMPDDDYYSIYLDADWPTHWMPLPDSPSMNPHQGEKT